ncbi:MAG: 3-methyl-2-oxobutanoate hydroxymethyltransferase [Planctomycetota bacterium]
MAENQSKKRLRPVTVPRFVKMKQDGKKITMLTAYDFPTAQLLDRAGVDVLLVGDSLAMVVQGHENTIPVTLREMIYHGEIVARAAERAMVIVDIPFPVNHHGVRETVKAAGRIMKQTGCQAVKLEGGADQADVIKALVTAGIPVMAHVGLRPQAVNVMGGYKVQRDHEELLKDAQAAEQAGAFGIVLECIPSTIAADLTQQLRIPTIGIGAGPDCDGQVLVVHDMLGLNSGYVPSFVKAYANMNRVVTDAVDQWCSEVRTGEFPDDDHSFQ